MSQARHIFVQTAAVGPARPCARPPRALHRVALATIALALGLALGACGGDDGDGGGGAKEQAGITEGAKVAPTLQASQDATGTVNFCMGKDSTGAYPQAVKDFKKKYAGQGLTAKIVNFPTGADEARQQFVQRQEARSADCDVFYSDIIWTPEFARQKWVLDMTDYVEGRRGEFIPSALAPMKFDGKYWGVPLASGAGLLYYRDDRVPQVPDSLQAVYAQAKKNGGIVYQGGSYEGLTVNFLEVAYAAGGKVISDDGKKALIDSPENLKALQLMVDGVTSGAAPRAVVTYMEEEARRAFETGKPAFMRNWAYAYSLGQQAPKVKGKFKVAPLPAFEGGSRAGVLGGNSPVISAYSKNPKGAVLLVDFITSPPIAEQNMVKFALPAALAETYDAPAVKKAVPFAAELKQAIAQAKPRPVSAVYPLISQAIYKNVNRALSRSISPQAALKRAQSQIEEALQTF